MHLFSFFLLWMFTEEEISPFKLNITLRQALAHDSASWLLIIRSMTDEKPAMLEWVGTALCHHE